MKNFFPLLMAVLFLVSCRPGNREGSQLLSFMPPTLTKVDFINQLTENEETNIIKYLYFNNGAGVAAGDINNDGLPDLCFTSNQGSDKLYLNKGNFVFEDITDKAGIAGSGNWKTGVTMADVNGDGFPDIYICQVGSFKNFTGRNQLFINQGNETFKEEAAEYGLDFSGLSTQAAFFDYDLDGDLDMYLLNHSIHTVRSYGDTSLRRSFDRVAGDRLFRNDAKDGKRFFHDVTAAAGIYSSQTGYGLGISVSDLNMDGYPDIFISNDFHENDYLYINNGDGTFTERIADSFAHTSRSSMGNDVADFNNDGLPDVCVLDMLPEEEKIRKQSGGEDDYELHKIRQDFGYLHQFTRNTLQLNQGGGLFSEIGRLSGIFSTDWSWAPLFCDLDNDGWKDLFITTGIYRRANDLDYIHFLTGGNRFSPQKDNRFLTDSMLYSQMPLHPNLSYLYRNNGDLTFTNKAQEWGIGKKAYSNGSAYADLDRDGDLDLVINNINDKAFIYRNNAESLTGHHFLTVALKGTLLNSQAVGTRVTLYAGGKQQVLEQFFTRGFMSASADHLHFGLGEATVVDSLVVRWPDLKTQTITQIRGNQIITLDMANASEEKSDGFSTPDGRLLFTRVPIPGLDFLHREDPYVGFFREPLAPLSLTSEGPALATGDINGDGRDDLFCGGAKNQPSLIYLQNQDGSFTKRVIPCISKETGADVVDAAFFDADGDRDADLFLVRGGSEWPAGHPELYDILLLNDGEGNFSKGSLPELSHNGSCVRPCDFDRDGDVDLFVGSRSFPGAYGWAAEQYLLENDGHGKFVHAATRLASLLTEGGMVTDAAWLDYDDDGAPDLVLTGEWMNVTLLKNEKGIFREVTSEAGLSETSGWWRSVRAADVNGDGKPDLIAGNTGLNTMVKASSKEPVEMYLTDFDNNGSLDQVICYWSNGTSYPFATFDELQGQIPELRKKYPSYRAFAGTSIKDIFGKKAIENSVCKKVVMLESCLFLNRGNGTFQREILPVEAQFSPIRAILSGDFNHDGKTEFVMAGNDYAVRPSYGRYDAGYGLFLQSASSGGYRVLGAAESGFAVKGDVRKIIQVTIKGEIHLVVGRNNDSLQIFK